MKPKSEASLLLKQHLDEFIGYGVVSEYQFCPPRRWRFDFACPLLRLGFELEGGIWMNKARHTSGAGYQADLIKYQHAAALKWIVFRFSTEDVLKGRDVEILKMWAGTR